MKYSAEYVGETFIDTVLQYYVKIINNKNNKKIPFNDITKEILLGIGEVKWTSSTGDKINITFSPRGDKCLLEVKSNNNTLDLESIFINQEPWKVFEYTN